MSVYGRLTLFSTILQFSRLAELPQSTMLIPINANPLMFRRSVNILTFLSFISIHMAPYKQKNRTHS